MKRHRCPIEIFVVVRTSWMDNGRTVYISNGKTDAEKWAKNDKESFPSAIYEITEWHNHFGRWDKIRSQVQL